MDNNEQSEYPFVCEQCHCIDGLQIYVEQIDYDLLQQPFKNQQVCIMCADCAQDWQVTPLTKDDIAKLAGF
jgi:hypothetical protein